VVSNLRASPFSDDHKILSIDKVYSLYVANNIGAKREKWPKCSRVGV
jgi:hypothetical protein